MRHRKKKKILSRPAASRQALLRGLLTSAVLHGRIRTTAAKAAVLRPELESLVTTAKANTVHARRRVAATLHTREAVQKLFSDIAPRFAERKGGYTRTLKLGHRFGDGADMVQIEFLPS